MEMRGTDKFRAHRFFPARLCFAFNFGLLLCLKPAKLLCHDGTLLDKQAFTW